MSKHIFAIAAAGVNLPVAAHNSIAIDAKSIIYHRLTHVLRLQNGDAFILFNEKNHALCVVQEITKKTVTVLVTSIFSNPVYRPHINLYLPLLKKENLEEAVYNAVEASVNSITLIATARSLATLAPHVRERLHSQMVSAAELSKNYTGTQLYGPLSLTEMLAQRDTVRPLIWGDINGKAFAEVYDTVTMAQHIDALIGPEGGFNPEEYALVAAHTNAHAMRLTPTILRASQAAGLLVGCIRLIEPLVAKK